MSLDAHPDCFFLRSLGLCPEHRLDSRQRGGIDCSVQTDLRLFHGYDEPNYTYTKNGKKLVGEIAAVGSGPVFTSGLISCSPHRGRHAGTEVQSTKTRTPKHLSGKSQSMTGPLPIVSSTRGSTPACETVRRNRLHAPSALGKARALSPGPGSRVGLTISTASAGLIRRRTSQKWGS